MKLGDLSQALCSSGLPALSGNFYCIGRNYRDHAKELGNEVPTEPVVFLKAPSAMRTLEKRELAFADESYHHEVELVYLVGRDRARGSAADITDIVGLSLGLDLTRREVQNQLKKAGLPWTTAKSFSGSGILHPFVTKKVDLGNIRFSLEVNDKVVQSGVSSDMIFDATAILQHLLKYQDLSAGDVIFSGTPAGVGPFKQGDRFRLISETLGIDGRGLL